MYYGAEHFHFSGVLAVVSGGLLLSSKRQHMLSYRSRLEGVNVWNNLVFVLNGLVFMLIGLQLPSIINQLGDVSLGSAIGYGLLISLVLIVTRILCTLGASVFTMFMSRFITVAENNPGWRNPLVIGWAGMRGVVSLAAALSIPLLINGEQPFPHRNLILFITFIVIMVTLVFQGLTLPWVVRRLKPTSPEVTIPEPEQELKIQRKIAHYSIQYLEKRFGENWQQNEHLKNLYERFTIDLKFFNQQLDGSGKGQENTLKNFQLIYLQMLEQQRAVLLAMNNKAEFNEELIRKYLSLIDMEEYKIREKLVEEKSSESEF
jgi:CPA1 family monovalent cation:H+ antiporter